ncbi:MAG: phage tail protein [Novosphingobium sp. 28-62-57]|nr:MULTISPECIES: tail protein X [unclassified Novosphingobium]OYW47349.1 MAG: phage tail protein [Novosphingobium sp. 12-63-9]OYZ08015.1 MAG: phage tail protein [Novosphingobium sp. 28-62-57]OYZ97838.1 MAG: phage tail protein [Novosphingobium sp. 17-62-8]HQS69236.1 tail protein X [Novosphingobium sp.]
MQAIAREGETVDEVCWRVLGRTSNVTEQVLELNPGIAALGAKLPAGTELLLPDLAEAAAAVRETIQLWD